MWIYTCQSHRQQRPAQCWALAELAQLAGPTLLVRPLGRQFHVPQQGIPWPLWAHHKDPGPNQPTNQPTNWSQSSPANRRPQADCQVASLQPISINGCLGPLPEDAGDILSVGYLQAALALLRSPQLCATCGVILADFFHGSWRVRCSHTKPLRSKAGLCHPSHFFLPREPSSCTNPFPLILKTPPPK